MIRIQRSPGLAVIVPDGFNTLVDIVEYVLEFVGIHSGIAFQRAQDRLAAFQFPGQFGPGIGLLQQFIQVDQEGDAETHVPGVH